jgi:transglutaminase-like putative cysteine protease
MYYRVRHATHYQYSGEVVHSHHLLHLEPRDMAHQRCTTRRVNIEPAPSVRIEGSDAFGNPITRLEFDRPHQSLRVASLLELDVRQRPAAGHVITERWEYTRNQLAYSARAPGPDKLEACRYRNESPHARIKQAFNDYGTECFPSGRPILAAADALMLKLFRQMTYAPGATGISTPLLEVLNTKRGVCQDYAHLMIACLRSRGLAARYVSGYLRTVPRPGGERLIGADASHAWVAVYCPPLGWVEFDPTNGVRAGLDHIVLAWGRDFGDVSPLRGVIVGGGQHKLSVSVAVEPG